MNNSKVEYRVRQIIPQSIGVTKGTCSLCVNASDGYCEFAGEVSSDHSCDKFSAGNEVRVEDTCDFFIGVIGNDKEDGVGVSRLVIGDFNKDCMIAAIASLHKLQFALLNTAKSQMRDHLEAMSFGMELIMVLENIDVMTGAKAADLEELINEIFK